MEAAVLSAFVRDLVISALLAVFLLALAARGQDLTFETLEEKSPGLLGNIAAKANLTSVLGQKELRSLQYTVVEDSGGGNSLFYVDQMTGDLSTTTTLDRERLCGSAAVCTVRCNVAVQSSSPESAFFRKFSVVVHVLDVNDNPPQFSQTSFVVNIPENAVTETVFVLPTATDPDVEPQFKVQRYAMEPRFQQFDLSVIKTTSADGDSQFAVNLKVIRPLDREAQQLYITSLVAFDGGNPPRKATLPLSIDVMDKNDNSPEFENPTYSKTLTEEAQRGSTVLVLVARDTDEGDNARVSYFLADSASVDVKNLFALNQDTGALTLLSSLNNRGGMTFTFDVVARDNGVPQRNSECKVTIEVLDTHNDRPQIEVNPLFSRHGAAVVPESAAIGRVTALLTVKDHDSGRNGLVSCQLDNAFFSLQKLELNEYKVIVAASLDRERQSNHSVSIRCSDGGDPPLSVASELRVEVSDINDNSPEFGSTNYVMSVPENEMIGTRVGQVKAVDVDYGEYANLIYGMDNNGDTFTIDTILGDIYTTRYLDRETTPRYSFNVYAYDGSSEPLTAVATVVVNVADRNDKPPIFGNSSYLFRVTERTPPGFFVGQIRATDDDTGLNARVEYYMVTRPRFPISVNTSGAVLVSGEVDYEASNAFRFVVAAVDQGSPPLNTTCNVTVEVVDSNDHSPVITFPSQENPTVSIPYNTEPGSEIAKVVAYDLDSGANGDLRYSMNVANITSVFYIDETSGVISLGNQVLPTDIRSYNIVVSVRDNGVPQMAQQALLRIDVITAAEMRPSDNNIKIVIALVCVTLFLALAVLTTLLLIRYFDQRRRSSSEKHRHEILTKSGYQPAEPLEKALGTEPSYMTEKGEPFRTATVFTSKREDTTVYSPKRDLNSLQQQKQQQLHQQKAAEAAQQQQQKHKKKTVSFERARQPSIMEEEGDCGPPPETRVLAGSGCGSGGATDTGGYYLTSSSSSAAGEPRETRVLTSISSSDTYPVQAVGELHSPGSFSTFKPPPPRSHLYDEQRRSPQQGVSSVGGGAVAQDKDQPADAVHLALRQHNALVRSMRNNSTSRAAPPPYQQQQRRGRLSSEGEKMGTALTMLAKPKRSEVSNASLPYDQKGAAEPRGDKDIEVWSSSSADTSDSGHGGSELDVSAVKVSV